MDATLDPTPYAADTPFQQRMARGHAVNTGHQMTGFYVAGDYEGTVKLVRTCCMDRTRIAYLRGELDAERISYGELADIESAFATVPDSALWDARENAMAGDMLDVLDAMVGKVGWWPIG